MCFNDEFIIYDAIIFSAFVAYFLYIDYLYYSERKKILKEIRKQHYDQEEYDALLAKYMKYVDKLCCRLKCMNVIFVFYLLITQKILILLVLIVLYSIKNFLDRIVKKKVASCFVNEEDDFEKGGYPDSHERN